jgi:hypothetical protein
VDGFADLIDVTYHRHVSDATGAGGVQPALRCAMRFGPM